MEATITKKFSLEAPIEEVWKSLSNPKEISGCVPGATITDQIDDNNYKGEVTLKFGPIKTKYDRSEERRVGKECRYRWST
mgnify:CR=1 FL=1